MGRSRYSNNHTIEVLGGNTLTINDNLVVSDTLTTDTLVVSSGITGPITVNGDLTVTGDITVDDITMDDLVVNQVTASGNITTTSPGGSVLCDEITFNSAQNRNYILPIENLYRQIILTRLNGTEALTTNSFVTDQVVIDPGVSATTWRIQISLAPLLARTALTNGISRVDLFISHSNAGLTTVDGLFVQIQVKGRAGTQSSFVNISNNIVTESPSVSPDTVTLVSYDFSTLGSYSVEISDVVMLIGQTAPTFSDIFIHRIEIVEEFDDISEVILSA